MRWAVFRKLILIEQTLFGLSWAMAGAFLPLVHSANIAKGHWNDPIRWSLVILAFMAARIGGMALNRLIDKKFDALNPRTKARSLPSGETTPRAVALLGALSLGLFMLICRLINPLCYAFSPVIVALLILYSFTKRFTILCHFVLGLIEFFAPFCAWIAMTDSFNGAALFLGLAALCSLAGMDIVYQMQDMEFDQQQGLRSLPAVMGMHASLWIARLLHGVVILSLAAVGALMRLTPVYFVGVVLVALLFFYHHRLITLQNLQQVPKLFFRCNTQVGGAVMALATIEVLWHVLF